MLSHEWRELEITFERVSDLRGRYTYAQRSKNHGQLEGLRTEIAVAMWQRENLVRHIAITLGRATTERNHRPDAAGHPPHWDDSPLQMRKAKGNATGSARAAVMIAFDA